MTCYHQKNSGPAAARNKGVELAGAELIFFTDADCIVNRDWLEQMALPFTKSEVAAVKGVYRTEQRAIVARFCQLEFAERFKMLSRRISIDMVDTYSAAFRREIFQTVGGFDTAFPVANNEDTELSYRMAAQGHLMVFNPNAVVQHLNHPDSIRKYFLLKFSRGYWRIMVYRMFPGKMVRDSYTPQSLKLQIIVLALILLILLLVPLFPQPAAMGVTCLFLVFLVLTLPFTVTGLQHDFLVGLASPLLLGVRAAAVGSGAIWGVFSALILKKGINHS